MIETELYVHIPFCVRKCAYCDFLSAPADEETKARYLAGLFDEFKSWGQRAKGRNITSVFVGGGTPTSLSAKQLDGLFCALRDTFDIPKAAEVTVECNPGTLDGEKLSALKSAGVNRLSIGLQSADNAELKLLGRIHTFEEFLLEYELARKTGFSNINVDIMQSLPGQDVEKALFTVRKVAELSPEHISAYSLIIEEGTPFYARFSGHPELLPGEDTDRAIYRSTKETLEAFGYRRYEISNYAKPGFSCRHNVGYWTGTDYIGMGLGAASLLEGERFSNLRDMSRYLECACEKEKAIVDPETVEKLSEKDKMAEFMFLGLRLTEGVEKAEFEKRFGKPLEAVYGKELDKHIHTGLIKDEKGRIALTERGIDISNAVLCDFLMD